MEYKIMKPGTLVKCKQSILVDYFDNVERLKVFYCKLESLSREEKDEYVWPDMKHTKQNDTFLYLEEIKDPNNYKWFICYSMMDKYYVAFFNNEIEEVEL